MLVRVKLLLMGLLCLAAVYFASARGHAWHWLVCAALGLSWLGDAMLAHYPPVAGKVRDPFIAGMGFFALAHMAYIAAFALSLSGMPLLRMRIPGALLGSELIPGLLPVYLLLGLLFWVLFILRTPQPGPVKAAVLVYAELLCAMGAFACGASFTGVSFVWLLPLGGLLFIVSDGVIALHVFHDRIESERRYEAAVWCTYLPAQVLLLLGTSFLY